MRLSFLVLCFLMLATAANAQLLDYLTTQNQFVKVNVLKISGQVQILTVNGDPLTFSGQGQWNSYTTFRFNASGTDHYFTNQAHKKYTGGMANVAGSQSTFVEADSTKKIGDTIRTYWGQSKFLSFQVHQDVYPIQTAGGGQIMIKYWVYSNAPGASSVFKGILLVLDLQVQQPSDSLTAACPINSDGPLVLTNLRYNARPREPGIVTSICWWGSEKKYDKDSGAGIPEWFLAGRRFPDYGPSGFLLGKGTLKGPGLTPPDLFFVTEWGNASTGLKDSTWDFTHLVTDRDYTDAAVAYQWNATLVAGLPPVEYTTAYGMNDHQGNLSVCGDSLMMIAKVSPRHHYRGTDGNYDSLNTHVDVWVVNTGHWSQMTQNDAVTLDLATAPEMIAPGQLTQPASETDVPGTTASNLDQCVVGHTSWVLVADTSGKDHSTDFDEKLTFSASDASNTAYNHRCQEMATVTYHGVPDTVAPKTAFTLSTPLRTDISVSDNSGNDAGVDSIVVLTNTGYRYIPPTVMDHCDRSVLTITVTLKPADTSLSRRFVFKVRDCKGNTKIDSVVWTPAGHVGVNEAWTPGTVTMHAYPNPFSGAAEIIFETQSAIAPDDVRLYSVLGADVSRNAGLRISETAQGVTARVDGSALTPGMYTIVARVEGTMVRQTVVVSR